MFRTERVFLRLICAIVFTAVFSVEGLFCFVHFS